MSLSERQRIAEELLGKGLDAGGLGVCPGVDRHTHSNGKRDFRVCLDGAPTGYCYHSSCSEEVAEFNLALRRAIWHAENGGRAAPRGHWGETASEPKGEKINVPKLDMAKVVEFTRGVPPIDEEWLRRRSPIDLATVRDASDFLWHLYEPEEKVLVFLREFSQGDFLSWVGHGNYRLARERGVKAVASKLPTGGSDGVWFLVQPVTGQWSINSGSAHSDQGPQWSRRWKGCVTSWRYFVLESDELDFATWLRVVANLPMPVAAIYTSGKRSIHTLLRLEMGSKAEWDAVRNIIRQMMCPLGADAGAMSAVRLSRLPFCHRGNGAGDKQQKLLFLNPHPEHEALRLLPEIRG